MRDAVSGYTATQHLSPNHVIDFDDADPDRAICTSYMYAQHHLDKLETGIPPKRGGIPFGLW